MNRYLLALVVLSSSAYGCSKDSSATTVGENAAAAKPGDKPASGDKKKLPNKTAAKKDEGGGKKGGKGGDAKPSSASHKAGSASLNASQKKKAEGDNPCESVPDGVAECHGDQLLFCHEKELWALDCNALMPAAHPELFTAGTCDETSEITDCTARRASDTWDAWS